MSITTIYTRTTCLCNLWVSSKRLCCVLAWLELQLAGSYGQSRRWCQFNGCIVACHHCSICVPTVGQCAS